MHPNEEENAKEDEISLSSNGGLECFNELKGVLFELNWKKALAFLPMLVLDSVFLFGATFVFFQIFGVVREIEGCVGAALLWGVNTKLTWRLTNFKR